MRAVDIVGIGITGFGKQEGESWRSLAATAVTRALGDAGVAVSEVDLLASGNAMAGLLGGQEMVRGQVVAGAAGLAGVPVVNVENACATSSTAMQVALDGIRAGSYDTAVVVGSEKMTGQGTRAALGAMTSAVELERIPEITRDLTGSDEPAGSFFMEVYARITRDYMQRSGATDADLADVAVKNSRHGTLNPNAQYRRARTRDEVLGSRLIADPLRTLMCSPIADGAAALVLRATERVEADVAPVRILASVLGSGLPGTTGPMLEERTARRAYEQAGVGPEDLDVVEVHDAASPNELLMYEELGLCAPGGGPKLLASGATTLGGRVPVNPDGGLVSRGHPVGATGVAQIVELVTQLRGRAGERQVPGARTALAENAGGYLHPDAAACTVTVLGVGR
ncbi:thiolase family protein [Actinomycetospora chiangmaiensis]|uniref:thiolase family protein n=1 Tax=Actinomycetospora chiangmaiensis TaxID=402650 RepID=UPI00036D7450|nr:thiolase family protein [Actinomycetospora chiangmaiensis]